MSYTQEQIDRANQVDLKEFLCSHGEQVIKSGNEYRWKRHDSLTIQGNKWFRHSQSKGGYPVEFVMEFFGKTFSEAMLMLIGEAPANNGAAAAPSEDFRLPPRNRYVARAMAYLRQRNIPEELVQEFYKEGLIYEDARHHNIVFVGKDETGIPRYTHCKGTEGSFRMDVQGSDKSHNFAYRSDGKSLFVFEAPIDLMSFIALYPKDWKPRNYLSLGGVGAKALEGFLSERKNIETVYICTDSDKAGNDAVNRLLESIPEYMTVIRLTPCEKDWNEVLKKKGQASGRKIYFTKDHAAWGIGKESGSHDSHERGSANRGGMVLASLHPIWKADDYSWQPRRGENLLCYAACGSLHQPKVFASDGAF